MRTLVGHIVAIALTFIVGWAVPSSLPLGSAAASASAIALDRGGRARELSVRGHAIFAGEALLAGDRAAGARDGVAGEARFDGPAALAPGPRGLVYVADADNGMIRAVALESGAVSTIAAGLTRPATLSYDGPSETLLVRDAHGLLSIDLRRGLVTALPGTE